MSKPYICLSSVGNSEKIALKNAKIGLDYLLKCWEKEKFFLVKPLLGDEIERELEKFI